VTYKYNGVKYTREYFADVINEVICVRISADHPGSVNFRARLHRGSSDNPHRQIDALFDSIQSIEDGLVLKAQLGGKGAVEAAMAVRVMIEGGVADCRNNIIVTNADSVVLLISGETAFRNPVADQAAILRLEVACRKPWKQLFKEHTERFTLLYSRVRLELPDSGFSSLATDKRLEKVNGETDNGLAALLFNYGRYLLIACSLSGLPANLQGIWNPDHQPVWGSKFTININTEMNYWPT
jgi:alpha-L-fucosidase 2